MELVIVTGLSGAGKSCVMNAMEDIGFFCVDNLPVKMVPVFAEEMKDDGRYQRVAVVCDIRAGLTAEDLQHSKALLDEQGINYKLLFIECRQDVLFSRYKQSRRSHPLMNEDVSLLLAIRKEEKLLSAVKNMCDYRLDTTQLSVSSCKIRVMGLFCENMNSLMHIHCMSFGFRHGVPEDADFVFDVRFLPNPYYISELKDKTGLDPEVSEYVMKYSAANIYLEKLREMLDFLVPECIHEGRSQLVVAVGCTGGHHRSVTFAQSLYEYLESKNYNVSVSHRDMQK
ncbi:MAG: RNase adapter RapZ [Acutalibacteraceae bacterium]